MDLLPGEGFGLVGLFEAVPHQVRAYVRVCYVSHPRRPPERHRRVRRHLFQSLPLSLSLSLRFLSFLFDNDAVFLLYMIDLLYLRLESGFNVDPLQF